ncbi:unnamed protein product [Moneuplotes crassus]|uniref:Ubiquitin-like protease family profile domain-containing protein n=1 Tax=Euplotes crassus TaxID=5936 RepID=A0AAD1X7E7_EUPCR|nr:unnamed protein product [Moneuplotes crassus]
MEDTKAQRIRTAVKARTFPSQPRERAKAKKMNLEATRNCKKREQKAIKKTQHLSYKTQIFDIFLDQNPRRDRLPHEKSEFTQYELDLVTTNKQGKLLAEMKSKQIIFEELHLRSSYLENEMQLTSNGSVKYRKVPKKANHNIQDRPEVKRKEESNQTITLVVNKVDKLVSPHKKYPILSIQPKPTRARIKKRKNPPPPPTTSLNPPQNPPQTLSSSLPKAASTPTPPLKTPTHPSPPHPSPEITPPVQIPSSPCQDPPQAPNPAPTSVNSPVKPRAAAALQPSLVPSGSLINGLVRLVQMKERADLNVKMQGLLWDYRDKVQELSMEDIIIKDIKDNCKKFLIFKTQFWSYLSDEKVDQAQRYEIADKYIKEMLFAGDRLRFNGEKLIEKIIIPMVNQDHWFLAVVDLVDLRIALYDSMFYKNQDTSLMTFKDLCRYFKNSAIIQAMIQRSKAFYLHGEKIGYFVKRQPMTLSEDFSDFQVYLANCPQQEHLGSSDLHVCLNLYCICIGLSDQFDYIMNETFTRTCLLRSLGNAHISFLHSINPVKRLLWSNIIQPIAQPPIGFPEASPIYPQVGAYIRNIYDSTN